MKIFLLSAFSFLMINSVCFANTNEIDPDTKTPRDYSVEIQDSNHKIVYTANINNLSKTPQEQNRDVSFVDNCIKNNGIVESTKSSVRIGFKTFFVETDNTPTSLVINVNQIVSKQKINIGDCSIEDLSIGTSILTQSLPFLSYEYSFHLNDSKGKELPELYHLKIQSSKLLNN